MLEYSAMAGEHIIIFEQHNDMTELVASRLSRHAYEVDVTADGAEGLKLARTLKPDLLVLDATLSATAGRTTLTQVRSDPATADIPVLVLSGTLAPISMLRLPPPFGVIVTV